MDFNFKGHGQVITRRIDEPIVCLRALRRDRDFYVQALVQLRRREHNLRERQLRPGRPPRTPTPATLRRGIPPASVQEARAVALLMEAVQPFVRELWRGPGGRAPMDGRNPGMRAADIRSRLNGSRLRLARFAALTTRLRVWLYELRAYWASDYPLRLIGLTPAQYARLADAERGCEVPDSELHALNRSLRKLFEAVWARNRMAWKFAPGQLMSDDEIERLIARCQHEIRVLRQARADLHDCLLNLRLPGNRQAAQAAGLGRKAFEATLYKWQPPLVRPLRHLRKLIRDVERLFRAVRGRPPRADHHAALRPAKRRSDLWIADRLRAARACLAEFETLRTPLLDALRTLAREYPASAPASVIGVTPAAWYTILTGVPTGHFAWERMDQVARLYAHARQRRRKIGR